MIRMGVGSTSVTRSSSSVLDAADDALEHNTRLTIDEHIDGAQVGSFSVTYTQHDIDHSGYLDAATGLLDFKMADDGTDVSISGRFDACPCFAGGTMIATAGGETPVERLATGGVVCLADGSDRTIRWVGHRRAADIVLVRDGARALGYLDATCS